MRFILAFWFAWFAVVGLREWSMGNSHTVLQWIVLLGTPVAELVLCQCLLHWLGRFTSRVSRVMRQGISLFLIVILASQYYYYYVSGEFITLLAFENLNQAYLLMDAKMALLGCLVLAIWKWTSQAHVTNISSKWGGARIGSIGLGGLAEYGHQYPSCETLPASISDLPILQGFRWLCERGV